MLHFYTSANFTGVSVCQFYLAENTKWNIFTWKKCQLFDTCQINAISIPKL